MHLIELEIERDTLLDCGIPPHSSIFWELSLVGSLLHSKPVIDQPT
jgi:hypothetical protein